MKSMFNLLIYLCLQTAYAEEVQDIYKYKNKEGVIEFTDELKPNASPKKHIQIKRSTEEENAIREEKLELIKAKDKELDKRLAIEREKKQRQELALKKQREKAKAEQLKIQQQTQQEQEQYYYGWPYWQHPMPMPPIHPGRPALPPRPRPLPAQLPAERH